MHSPETKSSDALSSALVGGLLGVILGIMGGFVVSAIFLETPKAEVNDLTFGMLGMARSGLVFVTILFGAALGGSVGAAAGAVIASRGNQAGLNRPDSQRPPDAGITFVNDKDSNHDPRS